MILIQRSNLTRGDINSEAPPSHCPTHCWLLQTVIAVTVLMVVDWPDLRPWLGNITFTTAAHLLDYVTVIDVRWWTLSCGIVISGGGHCLVALSCKVVDTVLWYCHVRWWTLSCDIVIIFISIHLLYQCGDIIILFIVSY